MFGFEPCLLEHFDNFCICKEAKMCSIQNSGILICPISKQYTHDIAHKCNIGNARDNASPRNKQLTHIGNRCPWIQQMLNHIPHDDIVEAFQNHLWIYIFHIHRKNFGKWRCKYRCLFIQLHTVKFCRWIVHPNLSKSRSAGTSDLKYTKSLWCQIHKFQEINTSRE